jgi:peroxiredoxin
MTVSIGDIAPDFTLKNQHGQEVSLSSLRGKPVVIVFFPFAFTGICTGELCEIRDNLSVFTDEGAVVVAISCDAFFSNRVFSDREGYTFDILSDFWPHGAVSQAYGVFEESAGAARRATFLVDADGVVRWTVDNPLGEARDFAGYKEALSALS